MDRLLVFMKRSSNRACSFEVSSTAKFPGIPARPLSGEEVFQRGVPVGPGSMHPFATVNPSLPSEVLEDAAILLNAIFIAFSSTTDLGPYQILNIMTTLPGHIGCPEDLQKFILPKADMPSLRRVDASVRESKQALKHKDQLERASTALQGAETLLRAARPQDAALGAAVRIYSDHAGQKMLDRPQRISGPPQPSAVHEEYSEAAIAATQKTFLRFFEACERTKAQLAYLREDLEEVTETALDVLGIHKSTASQGQHCTPRKEDLPCRNLDHLEKLDNYCKSDIGRSVLFTAVRATTRGVSLKNFHNSALHALLSDDVLSRVHICEIEGLQNPYPKHDRTAIGNNLWTTYMRSCEQRCEDMFSIVDRQFFWFSAFAAFEASYNRRKRREAAAKYLDMGND